MCLGIPGKILEIDTQGPLKRQGKASFGGIVKEVNLSYVPEAEVGQYVIVHVGFAISVINEAEAQETLSYLKEMGELAELEGTSE